METQTEKADGAWNGNSVFIGFTSIMEYLGLKYQYHVEGYLRSLYIIIHVGQSLDCRPLYYINVY